jgi:hypothetical protein
MKAPDQAQLSVGAAEVLGRVRYIVGEESSA